MIGDPLLAVTATALEALAAVAAGTEATAIGTVNVTAPGNATVNGTVTATSVTGTGTTGAGGAAAPNGVRAPPLRSVVNPAPGPRLLLRKPRKRMTAPKPLLMSTEPTCTHFVPWTV